MSGKLSEWLTVFRQQLSANKKKAAALLALSLVLLVLVGRLFVSDSGPAVAEARPVIVAPVAPKDGVIPKTRPMPSEQSVPRTWDDTEGSRQKAAATHLGAEPAKAERAVPVDDMPRVLERDPFNIAASSRFLPATAHARGADGDPKASESPDAFWLQLCMAVSEYQQARKQESEQLEAELAELELQSTMTGSVPMAYISGRLVHEGDAIMGFSVIRIDDKRVTVRKLGSVRELVMP